MSVLRPEKRNRSPGLRASVAAFPPAPNVTARAAADPFCARSSSSAGGLGEPWPMRARVESLPPMTGRKQLLLATAELANALPQRVGRPLWRVSDRRQPPPVRLLRDQTHAGTPSTLLSGGHSPRVDWLRGRFFASEPIDLGGSWPALEDGLLRFKRKWGARLVEYEHSDYDLQVHWETVSPAVAAFFAQTNLDRS